MLQLRKDIAQGSLVGPRMVLSGPMLDGPAPRFPSSIPVATPDDGRRAVADLKRRGADFIKLQSLMLAESVDAILDEARKNGIPVAGHVPDAVRAIDASNAGQKSFEHLIGIFEASSSREDEFFKGGAKSAGKFLESFDAKKSAALIATLAKNQTWQCPTMVWERGGGLLDARDLAHDPLAKYAPASWKEEPEDIHERDPQGNVDDLATRRRFVDKAQEVISAMHRAGVPFLAGTDTAAGVYVFPGFSLHEELELFVNAGFTPREALETATTLPAKFLGMEDRLGSIARGKIADLVLLMPIPSKTFAARGRFSLSSRTAASSPEAIWTHSCAESKRKPQRTERLDRAALTRSNRPGGPVLPERGARGASRAKSEASLDEDRGEH